MLFTILQNASRGTAELVRGTENGDAEEASKGPPHRRRPADKRKISRCAGRTVLLAEWRKHDGLWELEKETPCLVL